MQNYLQYDGPNNVQSNVQSNVQNLSRLNVSDNMSSSNSRSNLFSTIPLPVIVLVVLHFVKNMVPVQLRKTVSAPMVAGGLSAVIFYYYRSNMAMAALYAALVYYVLYSMKPVEEKQEKSKQ